MSRYVLNTGHETWSTFCLRKSGIFFVISFAMTFETPLPMQDTLIVERPLNIMSPLFSSSDVWYLMTTRRTDEPNKMLNLHMGMRPMPPPALFTILLFPREDPPPIEVPPPRDVLEEPLAFLEPPPREPLSFE